MVGAQRLLRYCTTYLLKYLHKHLPTCVCMPVPRYNIDMKDITCVNFIIHCAGKGASFELIAHIACWFRNISTGHLNLHKIGRQLIRDTIAKVFARGLTLVRHILQDSGGYSVAVDGATGKGKFKVFAIHVRVFIAGELLDIAVCTLRLDGEDAVALFAAFADVMGMLDPQWVYKVIAYTSDGAPVVRSVLNGLGGKIRGAVKNQTGDRVVETFWCVAHRSNLVVKKSLRKCNMRTGGDDDCPLATEPSSADDDLYAVSDDGCEVPDCDDDDERPAMDTGLRPTGGADEGGSATAAGERLTDVNWAFFDEAEDGEDDEDRDSSDIEADDDIPVNATWAERKFGMFAAALIALSTRLRKNDMYRVLGQLCPTHVDTRWEKLYSLTRFIKKHFRPVRT
eukprot:GHVU01013876.1.p1 GENE.GHVU01013876.1~~GHVU01013876.1.p1  ORF type:complete len:396 (+),score=47.01 GHVU01013876.1:61-1248(+)